MILTTLFLLYLYFSHTLALFDTWNLWYNRFLHLIAWIIQEDIQGSRHRYCFFTLGMHVFIMSLNTVFFYNILCNSLCSFSKWGPATRTKSLVNSRQSLPDPEPSAPPGGFRVKVSNPFIADGAKEMVVTAMKDGTISSATSVVRKFERETCLHVLRGPNGQGVQ